MRQGTLALYSNRYDNGNYLNKKYIRVENKTEPSDMIEYLYNKDGDDGWNLPR